MRASRGAAKVSLSIAEKQRSSREVHGGTYGPRGWPDGPWDGQAETFTSHGNLSAFNEQHYSCFRTKPALVGRTGHHENSSTKRDEPTSVKREMSFQYRLRRKGVRSKVKLCVPVVQASRSVMYSKSWSSAHVNAIVSIMILVMRKLSTCAWY